MEYILISITGLRGSGKTTQVNRLVEYYNSKGIHAYSAGLYKRNVKQKKIFSETMKYMKEYGIAECAKEEMLMIMQAIGLRIAFEEYVKPYMETGGIILLDRYIETYDVDFRKVEAAHRILESFPKCDKNIILSIDLDKAMERVKCRDHIIEEGVYELQCKRYNFQNEVLLKSSEYVSVDSNQEEDAVFNSLKEIIDTVWEEKNKVKN